MYDSLDDAVDDLLRESDTEIYGTEDYDTVIAVLQEKWSDAARAASAAARKSKAGGGNWRKAARGAFVKSRAGRRMAVASGGKWEKKASGAISGGQDNAQVRKFLSRANAKQRRFRPEWDTGAPSSAGARKVAGTWTAMRTRGGPSSTGLIPPGKPRAHGSLKHRTSLASIQRPATGPTSAYQSLSRQLKKRRKQTPLQRLRGQLS